MISVPVSFNYMKISQTLIVPALKINAIMYENILEELGKSCIDMYYYADDNNSFWGDEPTDSSVMKANWCSRSNLPWLHTESGKLGVLM